MSSSSGLSNSGWALVAGPVDGADSLFYFCPLFILFFFADLGNTAQRGWTSAERVIAPDTKDVSAAAARNRIMVRMKRSRKASEISLRAMVLIGDWRLDIIVSLGHIHA